MIIQFLAHTHIKMILYLFCGSMDPYIGVTGHYISKQWTMERWMIHCGPANGRHTAEMIGQKLDNIIQELNLGEDVYKVITTDNAKSMLNATQKVSECVGLGLGCMDHVLQLIINNSIKKVPKMEASVKRFKKLARATHHSSLHIQKLKKACKDLNTSEPDQSKHCTFVKIHNPVDTRWNSLLMMMKGVLHLKPALQKIKFDIRERDGPLEILIPDEDEFQLIDKIVP